MRSKAVKKPLILGLTGGLASGKTSCARMFKQLGARLISADEIYHRLIKPKTALYQRLITAY